MKNRLRILLIIHSFPCISYNPVIVEQTIIDYFAPPASAFTYSNHITIGGRDRIMYIFYTKEFNSSASFITILDKSIPLLELLYSSLKHVYHLTFGGDKNRTIICTYVQEIHIKSSHDQLVAIDSTGQTLSLNRSDLG